MQMIKLFTQKSTGNLKTNDLELMKQIQQSHRMPGSYVKINCFHNRLARNNWKIKFFKLRSQQHPKKKKFIKYLGKYVTNGT